MSPNFLIRKLRHSGIINKTKRAHFDLQAKLVWMNPNSWLIWVYNIRFFVKIHAMQRLRPNYLHWSLQTSSQSQFKTIKYIFYSCSNYMCCRFQVFMNWNWAHTKVTFLGKQKLSYFWINIFFYKFTFYKELV